MPALPRDRVRPAALVLGHAFAADPAFRFALPDDAKRARKLTWLAERLMRLVWLAGGHVDAVDEAPSAVALWAPIERPFSEPLGLFFRAGLFATPFALGPGAVRRLAVLGGPTTALHRARAPLPHDYLMMLAVDPTRQGAGLGSTLLREGLERARRAGRPVWLETTNLRNVPFYVRHGFVEVERREVAGRVPLVGMVWSP